MDKPPKLLLGLVLSVPVAALTAVLVGWTFRVVWIEVVGEIMTAGLVATGLVFSVGMALFWHPDAPFRALWTRLVAALQRRYAMHK